MTDLHCAYCGKPHGQCAGAVSRARKIGAPLYCDRKCAGLGRRKHKSKAQRIEEKRVYDALYRERNRARIKENKRLHNLRTYDKAKAAVERKKKMARHIEYCRQPEYKEYKRQYDLIYHASGPKNPKGESQWISKSKALLRTTRKLLRQRAASTSQNVESAPDATSQT